MLLLLLLLLLRLLLWLLLAAALGCWKGFLQIASFSEEMEPGGWEMGLFVQGSLEIGGWKLDPGLRHSPTPVSTNVLAAVLFA